MNQKYTKILIAFILVLLLYKTCRHFYDKNAYAEPQDNNLTEKLKISVYYEALCPDSKFFITYQLQPVYEDLKNNLILDLVPYGKAQTIEIDGKITFHCQHDAIECFANKIHSCVIANVKDSLLQLKYVACMISDNMVPDEAGERCAKELNLDFEPIRNCATDGTGTLLLKHYGERTHALIPPVKFIPTIELNDTQKLAPQTAILKDFSKVVCQVFKTKPMRCT